MTAELGKVIANKSVSVSYFKIWGCTNRCKLSDLANGNKKRLETVEAGSIEPPQVSSISSPKHLQDSSSCRLAALFQ